MQNLNSEEKRLAEFACKVCLSRFSETNPGATGCAWLCLSNEYCPHVMNALQKGTKADIEFFVSFADGHTDQCRMTRHYDSMPDHAEIESTLTAYVARLKALYGGHVIHTGFTIHTK